MSKYEKVSTDMNFVDREKAVEKFWKENQIFEKSLDSHKEGETYTFMTVLLRPTENPILVTY